MAAKVSPYLFVFVALFGVVISDLDLLQDLCVANKAAGTTSYLNPYFSFLSHEFSNLYIYILIVGINVNGFPCKDEANVTEADFFFSGLANLGVINNSVGSVVIRANVEKIPGLNTLGVSLARIDYEPSGLNPPHTHHVPLRSSLFLMVNWMWDSSLQQTS